MTVKRQENKADLEVVVEALVEQVSVLARQVEAMTNMLAERSVPAGKDVDQTCAISLAENTNGSFVSLSDTNSVRITRTSLPDSRLVRKIISNRKARSQFFDGELFADPAWDMLLDLTAARVERTRISVTSLCIASGVPPTTALRWMGVMVDAGIFERTSDELDARRKFVRLSNKGAECIARYFEKIRWDDVV